MTTTATVALSVLLASAAAAGVSLALRPESDTAPVDATASLQLEVASLRQTQVQLQQEIERLRAAPAVAPVSAAPLRVAATLGDEQVAAAVEAYLQRRDGAKVAGAPTAEPEFDVATEFDSLAGTNFWSNGDLWKRVFAAGKMDEVVAKFEALAAANPNDIATQMNLSRAYMAYLQLDQSKWQYSMKADKVYDKVLALDETHWEARFSKAMSYSFYPDFLGKKKDAIANFEVLVQQQDLQPARPDQAQTYLYLGNLLEQSGNGARAREIWAKGAARHPENQDLQQKAHP